MDLRAHTGASALTPGRPAIRSIAVRAFVAFLVALIACTAPVAAPSTPSTPASAAPVPSETAALAQPSATPSPSAPPSPTTAPVAGPVSAGAVPEAGIVFFSDFGPPQTQLEQRVLYRYDGVTGALTSFGAGPLAVLGATGIAHDSAAGVYVRGIQGRWDLMHWDGTRASDQEFTACQVTNGYFASWCTVTPEGVGVGWGTHVARLCGAPQFVRFPGDARGRPIPAELCVISAWASDDGRVVIASGFVAAGAAAAGCASDLVQEEGTCYRRESWVIPAGSAPRKVQIPTLPGFINDYTLSMDGRYAAARHLGGLFLVDLATGNATHLGIASTEEPRWSRDGRLVFVRGGGRESWLDRTVVVATPDGSMREIRGYASDGGLPSGLAPVWDPAGKRLAWVASPTSAVRSDDPARDYLAGRGVGDRRVLVSDLTADPLEIRCGEGVGEGVRWSHDGTALLLLCRRPSLRLNAFDLWLQPLGTPGARAVPLVRGLTLGGVDPNGNAPSLTNTGWSRGLTVARP